MDKNYDFSGWVTRYGVRCSDKRTIMHNAFKHHDGARVPLVWNHQHDSPENTLGYIVLENHPDVGVYGYGYLNHSANGQLAKELVDHGDITGLSIFANQLRQDGTNVEHGMIREVSLVLAGANPEAFIDNVIRHGETVDDEVYIYSGDSDIALPESESEKTEEVIEHADKSANESASDDNRTIKDVLATFNEKQRTVLAAMIAQVLSGGTAFDEDEKNDKVEHADTKSGGETIGDVFETFNEEQKLVAYELIRQAMETVEEENKNKKEAEHSAIEEEIEGGDYSMRKNIFEQDGTSEEVLSQSEIKAIIDDTKRYGSLKESFLQHGIDDDQLVHTVTDDDSNTVTYGMANIDYLFPEDRLVNNRPIILNRNTGWVNEVMNAVHHTPFARIKSVFADITMDEARAKGYTKGNAKVDEVIGLLRRSTSPTTVYKKQKLDRDDIIDITDLDVVAWIKSEMRGKLNEELARAFLIGDQRSAGSDDKINESNIRPIWTDDELYTIHYRIVLPSTATEDQRAHAFIRACRKSRKEYQGTGDPVLFASEDIISDCLLMEDNTGRVVYDTEEKLATALRVKRVIGVPVMENLTRSGVAVPGEASATETRTLFGIIVNLADYTVGADKGGAVSMFDDFDIDYNREKYLIETRCSGALTVPKSAIAIEVVFTTTPAPAPDDET